MTTTVTTRTEYLERLRDLLPTRDARRILEEVDGLLQDRMEAELADADVDAAEAERRALAALGPADVLAENLASSPLRVDLATRRLFVRLLAVTFAVHLVLSIVLTVAGSERAAIPGLLGPLPRAPLAAVFSGVLAILLIDTGGLFLVFALFGRGKAPAALPRLQLHMKESRRDAALGLVLLALLALILHPFRDQIFAVRTEDGFVPFLAQDLLFVLPVVDIALVLFAIRQIVVLIHGGEHVIGVVADAIGSVVLGVALVFAATRGALVSFPDQSLGRTGADVLEDIVTRVFLVLFLLGALGLAVRFVKRCFRIRQLLARP